ncbi:MAG: TrmH family RNA methyltransferase [Bacteroidales bacterium]|jgi:tRNA/rRNA methyltransferase
MKIDFVLIQAAEPANVGSAARAIKTMGFDKLIVIKSEAHTHKDARILAHGSNDILQNIEEYNSIDELKNKYDLLIATSSRERSIRENFIPSHELNEFIRKREEKFENIAIIFGGEESGLSNEDLLKCDIVSYIHLADKYPSLNLSQAVMIYAYELSHIEKKEEKNRNKEIISQKHYRKKIETLFNEINLSSMPALKSKAFDMLIKQDVENSKIVMSLINQILKKIR